MDIQYCEATTTLLFVVGSCVFLPFLLFPFKHGLNFALDATTPFNHTERVNNLKQRAMLGVQ